MRIEEEISQNKAFADEYHKAVVNILFTAAWLNCLMTRHLKPFGISPEQYNVLRILRGQYPNPASITLIQDRMIDRSSNTSRLVEKLRQKGLVARSPAAHDRRQADVTISEPGLKLLEEAEPSINSLHALQSRISATEAEKLSDTLDKVRG